MCCLKTLFLNGNNLEGTIYYKVCEDPDRKLLIYDNAFCPPYPECIKYIGEQKCAK